MRSVRKATTAFAGMMLAGIIAVSGMSPAGAAPPYPTGSQATALVGGTPLIQANCPTLAAVPPAGGTSTLGTVTVYGPAGAQCSGNAANANGEYTITGAAPPDPALRFSAQCENNGGATNGFVDVPAGTTVPGQGVVATPTAVVANTTVTYPGGTTAVLNAVSTTATSVTRTAIQITSGPAAGTIIGRVVCGGAAYPLAISAPTAGATPDIAPIASPAEGSSSNRLLVIGGAIALVLVAQMVVGRSLVRRRRSGAAAS